MAVYPQHALAEKQRHSQCWLCFALSSASQRKLSHMIAGESTFPTYKSCWKAAPGPCPRKIRNLFLNQSKHSQFLFFCFLFLSLNYMHIILPVFCICHSPFFFCICHSPLYFPPYTFKQYPCKYFPANQNYKILCIPFTSHSSQCTILVLSTIGNLILIV